MSEVIYIYISKIPIFCSKKKHLVAYPSLTQVAVNGYNRKKIDDFIVVTGM